MCICVIEHVSIQGSRRINIARKPNFHFRCFIQKYLILSHSWIDGDVVDVEPRLEILGEEFEEVLNSLSDLDWRFMFLQKLRNSFAIN